MCTREECLPPKVLNRPFKIWIWSISDFECFWYSNVPYLDPHCDPMQQSNWNQFSPELIWAQARWTFLSQTSHVTLHFFDASKGPRHSPQPSTSLSSEDASSSKVTSPSFSTKKLMTSLPLSTVARFRFDRRRRIFVEISSSELSSPDSESWKKQELNFIISH